MKTPPPVATRESLIAKLTAVSHMQRGTLTEQYIRRPAPGGKGTVTLGPYFKFQVWEDGRNHTRSVPADEVDTLREDIANHHLFQQIFRQLADRIIAETRQLRASRRAANEDPAQALEKKTSGPGASPKNTGKRKPTSSYSASASAGNKTSKTRSNS